MYWQFFYFPVRAVPAEKGVASMEKQNECTTQSQVTSSEDEVAKRIAGLGNPAKFREIMIKESLRMTMGIIGPHDAWAGERGICVCTPS